jgi:hypothetical protein
MISKKKAATTNKFTYFSGHLMAMQVRRYNVEHITQYGRSGLL